MMMSILSTKLYIPEMRDNYVIRKTLVDRLTSGINMNNKLTLVSAPAGYGKTTLVLELLNSISLTSAWISLDDGDNDQAQFLTYLIAALKKAGVTIGSDTERLASDFNLSSTQASMTMIINDIAGLSEKIVLVLDDFHLINSPQVYDAVKFLIEHQPTNIHLIIITREDPHLPLPRLRVQRKIVEIRMEDLCFTREETEYFFKQVMELKLSTKAIETIAFRTEGWIAGLQLAGLSLNGCEEQDTEEFIRVFGGSHLYIIDYLVEEVINRQTGEVRDFLCKTSVLDRMNGELCDAVVGKDDCRLLLRELEKANLFLIPLDSKREWYRYHHLFADSLRTELSKKEEEQLHRKAALWLESNGFKQEAVKHALKSGDMLLSLRLVEDSTEQAFKDAKLTTLVKWLNMLPGDLVKCSEILSVRKAWALFLTGKTSEAVLHMNSLGEGFMEKATRHNKGLLMSLRALMAQYSGQDTSLSLAEEALKLLEPWDPISRVSTMNTLGWAQEGCGRIKEANETFRMAYDEGLKLGYTFITTLALVNLGTSLNTMGRRMEAIELYTGYIEGMTKEFWKPLPFIGVIYISIAGLYYEGNELENAKFYIDKGIELCHSISYSLMQNSGILAARIQFAIGEKEAAIKDMEKALNTSLDENLPGLTIRNTGVLTQLLLRSKNIEKAGRYGETLKSFTEDIKSGAGKDASLPYARLLIYQKFKGEALKLLESLEKETQKTRKVRELIVVYILYAEAYYTGQDYEKADLYLDKAISLAESQEYYRLFLDEEPIINDVIQNSKINEGQFSKKLMEYLNMQAAESKPFKKEQNRVFENEVKRQEGQEFIEKLSQREIDILNLLGKGMSNNEIAATLYISTNTTQWHISHIYSKLGVKSRTQAVLKAGEIGIL